MLLTLAALVGWEAPRGRLCSQGTPQSTEHLTSGPSLSLVNATKINLMSLKTVYCYHETTDKSLLGGIVFLIHSIEQMSQQLLARGCLVCCSCTGREVSIECKVTLFWSCQA